MAKARSEIDRLENEIKQAKIRLETLRSLVGDETIPQKPAGFVLTSAIRSVLEQNPTVSMSVDEIVKKIQAEWKYSPLRRSVQITLNTWSKDGKAIKDPAKAGHYRLE